jgi:hypothetical protein
MREGGGEGKAIHENKDIFVHSRCGRTEGLSFIAKGVGPRE